MIIGQLLLKGPLAIAQTTYKLKVVCNNRVSPQYTLWPWMIEEIEKRTNGRVKSDLFSYPELNLTGAETLRVIKEGSVLTQTAQSAARDLDDLRKWGGA